MDSVDLTSDQCGRLLRRVDADRQYYEALYFRMQTVGFPKSDPSYQRTRQVILSLRALCDQFAQGLRKGEHCRWSKRRRDWPQV